jgi:hypothetical protein
VEPTKTLGFWHVRTADGVEGWVYQTLVHVEEVEDVPTVPPATGPVATAVDSSWHKPTPAGAPSPGPLGSPTCPADREAGGDLETNRRKNRTDTPTTVHPGDVWRPDGAPESECLDKSQQLDSRPEGGHRASPEIGQVVGLDKRERIHARRQPRPPSVCGDLLLGDSALASSLRDDIHRAARAPFPELIGGGIDR